MNGTVFSLALRALVGRRRVVLIGLLPLLVVVMAILVSHFAGNAGAGAGYQVVTELGYGLVVPLVALLCANAVLGPEIEDGSVIYLLAAPVDRSSVAISKYAAALGTTWLLGAVPLLLAGLIVDAGNPRLAFAWFVAGLSAGAVYAAVFLAMGAMLRRAVIAGLLYALVWEGVLGSIFTAVRWFSVHDWGLRIATEIADAVPSPGLPLWYAIAACVAVLAGSLWLAGDRLRSFMLRGDT